MQSLIIFAKLPRPGEVKTRLGNVLGMQEAAAVYEGLAQRTFSLGDQLLSHGLRVYLFYDPKATEQEMRSWIGHPFEFARQIGETLGERMQAAFERTFADGSERTVIIGTDIPDLTVDAVVRAFDLLSAQDVVLGPSIDGGYYLLGMNRPTKDLFEGIAWSTRSVYQETLDRIAAFNLSHAVLGELPDIDTEEDYKRYVERISGD